MLNLQKSQRQKAPLRPRNGNGLVGPVDRTTAATEFSCNSNITRNTALILFDMQNTNGLTSCSWFNCVAALAAGR